MLQPKLLQIVSFSTLVATEHHLRYFLTMALNELTTEFLALVGTEYVLTVAYLKEENAMVERVYAMSASKTNKIKLETDTAHSAKNHQLLLFGAYRHQPGRHYVRLGIRPRQEYLLDPTGRSDVCQRGFHNVNFRTRLL